MKKRPGSLVDAYRSRITANGWSIDQEQLRAAAALQQLSDEFPRSSGLLGRLSSLWRRSTQQGGCSGAYLWGQPGRGKTLLMDLFVEAVPGCERTHFQPFMLDVHERLRVYDGELDPLGHVADDIARRCRWLCFDEFAVYNIADAMILRRLLEALIETRVHFIVTSNFAPDELYPGGLQRRRFLPAIELLSARLEVIELRSDRDYRIGSTEVNGDYLLLSGLEPREADERIRAAFCALAPQSEDLHPGEITVRGRRIECRGNVQGAVWLSFDALCRGRRASADYLELAQRYHTLVVGPVPVLSDADLAALRRLIHLVDAATNTGTQLIVAADAPPQELYTGERLAFEYQRTCSRLMRLFGAGTAWT
ncbi:MAG: cell division protein ZapE [Gammaproteobacteria bacterium AqS3]|nr:cell division protein ZapE [Gammaproteobacteria bacterium AqS3]